MMQDWKVDGEKATLGRRPQEMGDIQHRGGERDLCFMEPAYTHKLGHDLRKCTLVLEVKADHIPWAVTKRWVFAVDCEARTMTPLRRVQKWRAVRCVKRRAGSH
ncbi:MAG: hypothetical protein QOG31_962 [Thermoplasmata archaeon]|nr:hypothetical protein [Thermoplasmata archaeon]